MLPKPLLTIALVVFGGLSISAVAQKPPKPTNTAVTSIILPYDSGVAPALQIQDDGLGNYTHSATQTSMILANGDWRLDAYYISGPTRTISLRFDQPIAYTGPNGGDPVAPPSGSYKVNLGSECSNYGKSFSTLAPGQTMECPMNVHFDYGGKTYDLHMARLNANFPETDSVNVTCIFPTSGANPCSQWRISPSRTYTYTDAGGIERQGLRSVANLSYETTARGKLVYVKQGNFYLSFSIIVMNP